MYKKYIGLLCMLLVYSYQWCSHANFSFSIGPAWHSFCSQQFYCMPDPTVEEIIIMPVVEDIATQSQLMPYIEAGLRLLPCKHLNIAVSAGYGSFKNGAGLVNSAVSDLNFLVPGVSTADYFVMLGDALLGTRVCSSIFIADVAIGSDWEVPCICSNFNPLLGYVFNKQKPTLYTLGAAITRQFCNTWQGPYIGLEACISVTPCVDFVPVYKCVIAQLNSVLQVKQSAAGSSIAFTPNIAYSERYGRAWGNILGISLWYKQDNWRMGTTFDYLHYNNAKTINVSLNAPNINQAFFGQAPVAANAFIKRFIWQQFMWMFSVECTF